ncbi:MAG TPA: gamma-glutamylcyclotransferase family protein [Rubrobacter sp.]
MEEANVSRWWGGASGGDDASNARSAERRLDDLLGTGHALATYGTLVPGGPNHHVVAPLEVEWMEGLIEGDLIPSGWGVEQGYPGFRPRAGGAAVAVWVLRASRLADAWPELDRFEGEGYRRILVPVFAKEMDPAQEAGERRLYTVANLYAPTEAGPDADAS